MTRGQLRIAIALAVCLWCLVALPIAAQEPSGDVLPITPDPAACSPILSIDEVRATLATPPVAASPEALASPQVPVAVVEPDAFVLPDGEPVDEATFAAVADTLIRLTACINGENILGYYAQIAPSLLTMALSTQGLDDATLTMLAAQTPVPVAQEHWVTLVDIRETRLLPDGRIGALVDMFAPWFDNGIDTSFFTFVETDGRWLIDGIVDSLQTIYPPDAQATPVATG